MISSAIAEILISGSATSTIPQDSKAACVVQEHRVPFQLLSYHFLKLSLCSTIYIMPSFNNLEICNHIILT